jgi:bilirubin oxidase
LKKLLTLFIIGISITAFTQNQLIIPSTIETTDINLSLQNGTHQFITGHDTATMGVNGNILGPTLIVNDGDNLNINVTNNLGQPTTIHWHGMHVSAFNDGGPHTVIDPGTTWNPQFTVMNKASTMWYHPHLDEYTDEHVSKGIAGFIIIKDEEEAALNLPRTYGVDDIPLAIQTKQLDANYQIIHHTNHDDLLMVNATVNPYVEVPRQVVRLRLLNGTTQRVLNVGFSENRVFQLIGTDGGLLEAPLSLTRLQLASGERAEILVNLTGLLEGDTLQLMSYASEFPNGIYGATYPGMGQGLPLDNYTGNTLNGTDFNILQLNVVAQTANAITSIPSTLATLTPYLEADSDMSRTLTLESTTGGQQQLNGDFSINGVSLDMNTINITIPINNTEIWTIQNNSPISHPLHIHDVQYYILDINGSAPPAYAQGLKDTFLVPAAGSMRVITKFEDFADDTIPYMYHCHMLTHEDGGMMGQFVVVDPNASVNNLNFEDGFALFPNPSDNVYMTAKLKDNTASIKAYAVVDATGRIVNYHKIHENEISNMYSFPIFELAQGVYTLKIFTETTIYTKKFLKK